MSSASPFLPPELARFAELAPIAIDDPDDPRLGDYRHMRDRDLSAESGRFVAESELVVRRLLESRLVIHSILATMPRLAALGAALGPPSRCPIYLASQAVLDAVTGFHVHRGCLAIGERPAAGHPAASLPDDARTIVVLEDLVSADNIGACARNAAAFGVDALVFSPRAADPFYRKAVRVSIGAVFQLPIVRCTTWPGDLAVLKAAGFAIYGAVVDARATPLPDVHRAPAAKVALLLGSEGPGLSPAARAACDRLVTIPMSAGADSLNVATAGAVALYHLQRLSA
jgi:tRNA G18 (ribose-2'-O)-methylase SpoU